MLYKKKLNQICIHTSNTRALCLLSNDACLPAIPAIGGHFNLDNNASKWIITLWF